MDGVTIEGRLGEELMKKIDFMYFDAGGGHRAAANALREVIAEQKRPWEVRLVNLQELLDSLDIFRKLTGLRLQDCYNLMLKKGWTLGSPQLTRFMQALIRLYHPGQVKLLKEFWSNERPDMVVSLVPNLNRAMAESIRSTMAYVPFVTILTDLADYPPHFWIERESQYLICGTQKAVDQAHASGHKDTHVFRTSGMILHPKFYETRDLDRDAERKRLKLNPSLPAGLMLFGGQGSAEMLPIAQKLSHVQMIAICGKNEELAAKLRRLERLQPMFVVGFTTDVPYYMRLSDFFIGKPGPASISEALAIGLPVIVERNSRTLPQERYNADWIVERQLGLVLNNFRDIDKVVKELLDYDSYIHFRVAAQNLKNRAVFEIPDILERILATA
jgi:glycosyl transferase family 28/monogalactosyldiacylglycerol (MGDG) synthase